MQEPGLNAPAVPKVPPAPENPGTADSVVPASPMPTPLMAAPPVPVPPPVVPAAKPAELPPCPPILQEPAPAVQPPDPTPSPEPPAPPQSDQNAPEEATDLRTQRRAASATAGRTASGADAERVPLAPGTQVGDYTITNKIGIGGFGIVYAATHTENGTPVAIKEHLPEGLAIREPGSNYVIHASPEQEERFRATVDEFMQEVAVLMGISHPGIVPILSAFAANGTAYYVMPFVRGEALSISEQASLSFSQKSQEARRNRRLLLSLLSTLDYLRTHQIVHRDIKPDNILVTPEGEPVLLDFGSARQLQTGKIFTNVFTPDFAAPEQSRAKNDEEMSENLGQWTDLYALGVVMYYLVTRLYPPRSELRVLSAEDPYTRLTGRADLEELYGTAFLRAIDRALELKIEDRWQSAAAWRVAVGEGRLTQKAEKKKEPVRVSSLVPLALLAILGGISFWALWERRAAIQAYDNSARFTEKLLYDFNQEITDIPASTRLQGILSEHLNEYLNNLGRPPGGRDEKLTLSLAAAWRNLGVLLLQQGKLKEADRGLAQAERYFRSLCKQHADQASYRYDLAGVLLNRVEVARGRNRAGEQEQQLSEAKNILEHLCRETPHNPEFRCTLGEALGEEALLTGTMGREELHDKALSDMLVLYRDLLTSFSDHVKARQGLGYALIYNAESDIKRKDFSKAEKRLDEARTLFSALTREHPYRLSFKKGLSQTLFTLANLHTLAADTATDPAEKKRQDDLALENYRRHNELVSYLETQDERKTEYPYMICRALSNMVTILLRHDQPNLAESYCRTIMGKVEQLRRTAPENMDFAMLESAAWRGMALAHSYNGKDKEQANADFARYRRLAEQLFNQSPNNTALQFLYADALVESANFDRREGNLDRAARWYTRAKDLLLKLVQTSPQHTEYTNLLHRVQEELSTMPKKK